MNQKISLRIMTLNYSILCLDFIILQDILILIKQKIAELSDKYDVYILEDDFLGDLDLNSKSDPIFTFNPNGKIIYVKSFSKILFPGLRVATVILPKDLIKDFRYYKFCRDFSTPSLSLEIIANQFEDGILVQHLTKMKKLYY